MDDNTSSSNTGPATKQDILDAEQRIIETLRRYVDERLEATETKLLGAFFSYQEYTRVEMRKLKADLSNVNTAAELRFDNIESRLTTLERAVLSKPPAQQPPQSSS